MNSPLSGDDAFEVLRLVALLLLLLPLVLTLSPTNRRRFRLAGGSLVAGGLVVALVLFGLWLMG